VSLNLSGEITATATVVLAVFAILTAAFAILAFLKQSKEVRDQASMLAIQSEQLAEQRKLNADQLKVLALQAAELSQSLEERKREAVERRSAQASRVFISQEARVKSASVRVRLVDGKPVRVPPDPQNVIAYIRIVNSSDQPVYDASLWWHRAPEAHADPAPEALGTLLPGAEMQKDREFPPSTSMAAVGAVLTFRDAAGVDWIRTADGLLMHAESDLALDVAQLPR
jgi:hypothetical protein